MKKNWKFAIIGLMGFGFAASLQTEAFAWSCLAGARDGASGWSYNYPNRRSAITFFAACIAGEKRIWRPK